MPIAASARSIGRVPNIRCVPNVSRVPNISRVHHIVSNGWLRLARLSCGVISQQLRHRLAPFGPLVLVPNLTLNLPLDSMDQTVPYGRSVPAMLRSVPVEMRRTEMFARFGLGHARRRGL